MNQTHLQEATSAARVATRVRRSLELGEGVAEAVDARQVIPAAGFIGLSLLCVGAMVLAGVLSSHDCRAKPIPLALGLDAEASIAVPANTPCTILVQAGSTALDSITIDAPPERGTLTPRGRTGVVYRPQRGFKGEDAFAFSLHGRPSSVRETSIIRVRSSVN